MQIYLFFATSPNIYDNSWKSSQEKKVTLQNHNCNGEIHGEIIFNN